MQWKGRLYVSAIVGLNDYKVKVKGKERLYLANLLKKYFERDEPEELPATAVETGMQDKDE